MKLDGDKATCSAKKALVYHIQRLSFLCFFDFIMLFCPEQNLKTLKGTDLKLKDKDEW